MLDLNKTESWDQDQEAAMIKEAKNRRRLAALMIALAGLVLFTGKSFIPRRKDGLFTGRNLLGFKDRKCRGVTCENGGTCNTDTGKCDCPPGFTGDRCDDALITDECTQNPDNCPANASCETGSGGFLECQCDSGFEGDPTVGCTNIDDCDSDPCVHGTCEDRDNDYFCDCEPGYTGKNCDADENNCTPNPCQNGGACTDKVNGYQCQCKPGFSGTNCENRDPVIYVDGVLGHDSYIGSVEKPVKTIQKGISLASLSKPLVLVTVGDYTGTVILKNGVTVRGSCDRNTWTCSNTKTSKITGGTYGGYNKVGVSGSSITGANTVIEYFEIISASSVPTPSKSASSYGIRCISCPGLVIRNNKITALAGGTGASGSSYGSSRALSGTNGSNGSRGNCDTSAYGHGGSGASRRDCPSGYDSGSGGSGGRGGNGESSSNSVKNGAPGRNGLSGIGTGGGSGGSGRPGGDWGDPGKPGYSGYSGSSGSSGTQGSGGSNAINGYSGGFYVGQFGVQGSYGSPGGGGGGGGGSGGQSGFWVNDGSGGGGGGGGSGGCGGAGGRRGSPGGSSFAIYATSSNGIKIQNNRLVTSRGGNGGAGGYGQYGGIAGNGGSGAIPTHDCSDDTGKGGNGGSGGYGGQGGRGGGGAGGPSIGILLRSTSGSTITGNSYSTQLGGSGGTPGGAIGRRQNTANV